MNKYRVLQIVIPDMAIVYGGVRGRTLSSRHQAHAWKAMVEAGIKQVIDLRQDYKGDKYKEECLSHGVSYYHYPVHKGRETIANMVKEFDVFCSLIENGDFFISCAQGLHRTDIALCTYWVFHGADKGKEPPVLVGYLEERGQNAGKIFHVLNVFYELLTEQNGHEPMPLEVFKERKGIIHDISQNTAKERHARNMVKLMYLYMECEIDDDEFENDFGRLRDEWTAVSKEVPLWLQKLSKQYNHLMQVKQDGPEFDDGIEHDYDWFSTVFRYDVMATLQMLRNDGKYTDIILNDYSKYIKT